MNDVYRTLQLDENNRVKISYEADPVDSPALCYHCLIYSLDNCNCINIREGDSCVISDLEDVERNVTCWAYTGKRSVWRALIKHLERAGYDARVYQEPGTCPGDWANMLIAIPKYHGISLDSVQKDVSRWYNNEYWILTHERRHVWRDATGATLETWDTVDSLGAVALEDPDNDDEVRNCCRNYFALEAAA